MTALASRFSITGDVRCFAGEALTVELAFGTSDAPVALGDRLFAWTIFRSTDREPLFTSAGVVVSADGDHFVRFAVDGDTTDTLFRTDRTRLRHQIVELTNGGRTPWVAGIFSIATSAAGDTPVEVTGGDGEVTRFVFDYQTRRLTLTPRGAAGWNATREMFVAGIIDAPTPAALDAHLVAAGEQAVTPLVEQAECARDGAIGAAMAAGGAATAAIGARDAAAGNATSAATARTGAEAARDAAGTAKTGAETARDAAAASSTAAGTAKTGAETARDAALGARDAAAGSAQAASDTAAGVTAAIGNAANTAAQQAAAAVSATVNTARDQAQAAAVSVGAPASRELLRSAALASTMWTKIEFRQSAAPANTATIGEVWLARDGGADWAVGSIIDALEASITVAVAAVSLRVRVWQVATTDANVNVGPPQANDVLISDTSPVVNALEAFDGGATGAPANTTERPMVLPLTVPIIVQANTTYKISIKALDGSGNEVAIGIGTRTITNPGRQRYNGGARAAPGAATFTNTSTALQRSIGALSRPPRSSGAIQATVDAHTASLSAGSQTRVTRINVENDNNLYALSALLPKVPPDAVTDSGDSLIANANGGAGTYNATGAMAPFIGGTLTNLGVGGTRSDQIRSTFLALAAGQRDDFGLTNGGTNDVAQQASSIVSATITAAGTGGTAGTYTVPTTGGILNAGGTQASYSVTIAGGAITAATPINIGGGFTAAPTFDLSGIPGLTGAVLTPALDVVASVLANVTLIMNDATVAAAGRRLIMSPWVSSGSGAKIWGQSRKIAAAEKLAYGARFFDALPYLARWHAGTEADLAAVRTGVIPPYLTTDGLHPSDNAIGILARERARMIRAQAGIGAPYIHDELVGAKNGDAAGTAIATLRVLGTPKGIVIADGNPTDAVRLNTATGALTRGAGALPAITELTVQAESQGLGRSNLARVVVVRQMDGTNPQSAVRVRGQAGTTAAVVAPTAPGLVGGGLTKKLTIVMLARMNNPTNGGIITQKGNAGADMSILAKAALGLNFTPRTNAAALIGSIGATSLKPVDPLDWCLWAFSLDTTTGVQVIRGAVNEDTPVTGTAPTADAQVDLSLTTYLFASAGLPLINFDLKMLWVATDYIDVSQAANRALFYDPVTRLPKDLGTAGTVAGITPIIFTRGMAGDYVLGKNYGSGGDFYVPPYINADNVPFVDVMA